jgi:transcriptional regulator with XRE-family HTH domain
MSKVLEKKVQERREMLATNIFKMRTRKELSQQKLADLAGVDRKTVNRIENGHFSPSVDTLVRLADAFGSPITKLLS